MDTCQEADVPRTWQEWDVTLDAALSGPLLSSPPRREALGRRRRSAVHCFCPFRFLLELRAGERMWASWRLLEVAVFMFLKNSCKSAPRKCAKFVLCSVCMRYFSESYSIYPPAVSQRALLNPTPTIFNSTTSFMSLFQTWWSYSKAGRCKQMALFCGV